MRFILVFFFVVSFFSFFSCFLDIVRFRFFFICLVFFANGLAGP